MNEAQATPHAELIAELINPNNPKNEREHAAVREIERLREALAQPAQESVAESLRQSKENFTRQFGESPVATWVYQDIAELFGGTRPAAQPAQEPVAWMNNKDFEPIRVRIMQEAYELADRNDSEGYNAIKVMCGDVQRMLPPQRERVLFPTMLRKMWSGSEVQEWLDKNVNKEKELNEQVKAS